MIELLSFKLVAVVLSSGFLFLAYIAKRVIGTWLNPNSILSFFWFLYTMLPLILVNDAPINPMAIFYILVFCTCFSIGMLAFPWISAFNSNQLKPDATLVFGTQSFRLLFFIISSITVLSMILGMINQGFSFSEMLNPMAMAGAFANKRYGSELTSNVFAQAGLQGAYLTIVIGGLYYGAINGNKEKLLVLFLSFLPSILAMSLQSAKGLFFFSIFIFYSGILVTNIYNQKFELISKKVLFKFIMFLLCIFPILIASFLSRGMSEASSEVAIAKIYAYLVSYSSGHLYAFSDWFSERYFVYSSIPYTQESLTGGFYTFMSFFRLLGDDRVIPMGTYIEYFSHSNYLKTNIYTVYRGLITDFTLIGSLVIAVFMGLVVNFSFYRLLVERLSAFYIVFFVFFVGLSYQTYLISSLMWKTIPFVFIVSSLLVFLILSQNKIRDVR
jgi:oligosaccharide repeat unit polymerase